MPHDGRAARGRSPSDKLIRPVVAVAQVVRASGCGPEGRGLNSPRSPQLKSQLTADPPGSAVCVEGAATASRATYRATITRPGPGTAPAITRPPSVRSANAAAARHVCGVPAARRQLRAPLRVACLRRWCCSGYGSRRQHRLARRLPGSPSAWTSCRIHATRAPSQRARPNRGSSHDRLSKRIRSRPTGDHTSQSCPHHHKKAPVTGAQNNPTPAKRRGGAAAGHPLRGRRRGTHGPSPAP